MLIAIVDDIAEERILLRTRLENILNQKNVEFHCYEYENGEAFLKASKEHDFTVLFLDIYMALKQRRPSHPTPKLRQGHDLPMSVKLRLA